MLTPLLFLALISDSFTLTGPGATYHGFQIPDADALRYKLTDDGALIAHPVEFGGIYRTEHFQMAAVYLKDCFGNHAGSLSLGYKYDLGRYFTVGGTAGYFVRESFPGKAPPFVTRTHGVDLIPLPGLTASAALPLTRHVSLEANILANGFINHGTIGIKLDLP